MALAVERVEREFNPYDLNHVADMDKFIKQKRKETLLELTKQSHGPKKIPKEGILARSKKNKKSSK
jgi:hypothetical protein